MGLIGYFSAEIGLESDLPTYSGGLGVLAGDHVKSAADAEIDLVAVTLLYRKGYCLQKLDQMGNQIDRSVSYEPSDFLEKTTWTLAIALIALSLLSNFAIPRNTLEESTEIKAQEQIDDAVIPNLPQAPTNE